MTLSYIDLSDRHGHRDDHGFSCGAEFNVKTRRRVDIPDFVREQLSASEIDTIWWEEAGRSRDDLRETLRKRYKWIGELAFVGRGPGWLAIEDTGCKPRNWDTIGKIVEKRLKEFITSMEDAATWRDVRGVGAVSGARKPTRHATKKSSSKKTWHIFETGRATGDRWVTGPYMTKGRAEELARRYMTDPPGPDSLRRSGMYIVKDHGP
jgi:hypothetical protein